MTGLGPTTVPLDEFLFTVDINWICTRPSMDHIAGMPYNDLTSFSITGMMRSARELLRDSTRLG